MRRALASASARASSASSVAASALCFVRGACRLVLGDDDGRFGVAGLVVRAVPLQQRHAADDDRGDEQRANASEQAAEAAEPLRGFLLLARLQRAAGIEEGALQRIERRLARLDPLVDRGEARAAVQLALVALQRLPACADSVR